MAGVEHASLTCLIDAAWANWLGRGIEQSPAEDAELRMVWQFSASRSQGSPGRRSRNCRPAGLSFMGVLPNRSGA
jgi:hypothetical protein